MCVRHDQLDPAQAAAGQAAQELDPERLRLAVADGHAEHLAAPVRVDADGDDNGDGDDVIVAADLHVGGVEPDIGPIAFDRPVKEGVHALVASAQMPDMACLTCASLGRGVCASNAAACMIWPDWQYPHCGTCSATQACCTGCWSCGLRPSMVVTFVPAAAASVIWQDRTGSPSW